MSATPEVLISIEPGRNKLGVFEDLRHVQEQIGFVPAREIERIATRRAVAVKDVHTVASFYPHFHLKPPIRVDVRVCDDMSCHLNGSRALKKSLETQYANATDLVQVRDISCVGRCDHAPVVSINEHYYEHCNFRDVVNIVDKEILAPREEQHSPPPRSPEERGLAIQCDPYPTEADHYSIFRGLLRERNFDEVLAKLKTGELRGMGGAGFPAHIKWEGARKSPGKEKFVVCNADESEPGTIKDRFILQYLPHMVFEGMMVCGAIVGAQKGYLYIRHEYELQTEVLNEELRHIYDLGLLGKNILGTGFNFDLEVFVSPGGYICGEETALMEAIQGNRSEPRNKPPRTVNSGVWGKPTALNNVETFCHAITILGKGGDWYHNIGLPGSPGIKFVGVTGHVKHPGVFEVPMGTSYRDLIYKYAGGPPDGHEVIGFAPSGPSSGYLPASMLDTEMNWDKLKALGSMVGSGAVVVVADHGCMLDMALNSVAFYRNESCGKCSPCRIGTQKLVDLLTNWTSGDVGAGDSAMLRDLSNVLRTASLCGLGQISPAPIQSVMKHFPEVMKQHLEDKYCSAGICFQNAKTERDVSEHAAASGSSHGSGHEMMTLTIDGQEVTVPHGTSVFDAARILGITIPVLCHQQNQTPIGVCRICLCDVGERALQAACVFKAEPGMVVHTDTEPIKAVRKTLYELMLTDHPSPCLRQQQSGDCELETQAAKAGIVPPDVRFKKRAVPVMSEDDTSPAIHVDYSACILCDRCIRGCSEIRHNNVIARQGKGYFTTIAFDANEPMGNSSCVTCGECMVSCPTGALTNKKVLGQNLLEQLKEQNGPTVEAFSVEVEDLLALPIFKGVSGTFLSLNAGAVVRRNYSAGEIIVREGETGSTAFYILEGDADVYLGSPRAHVTTQSEPEGLFSRMRSMLKPLKTNKREEERPENPSYIRIDAPVDLPYDNPLATLGPGDLFGEMTCMSFYPRSATVRAKTDCVMLEMLRNVLDVMQKNKTFRSQLEANYRGRALGTHLRSVPIFSTISEDFIDLLRDRVELVRYAPGQVICTEGDIADAFYLVRIGFVRVSQMRGDEELVLAYLPRGGYFGEMDLLRDVPRTATCTALDHVEVVKIYAPDFAEMLLRFPEVRLQIENVARQREKENVFQAKRSADKANSAPLHSFLAQGLMDAQSLLILDLEKCTRCDQCVKACAEAHDGVTRLLRDGVRFDHYLVATSCRQCRDPLCMVGCPVGSIRRRNSLEVIIEDWCVGCGLCASNCPYGNITVQTFDPETAEGKYKDLTAQGKVRKATSCDLCHDLEEPSCVYACPHDAAHRVNPTEFFSKMLGQDLSSDISSALSTSPIEVKR